ncbi:MAG: alpha/beta fold hydrolase [Haloarculaceae archaeon]
MYPQFPWGSDQSGIVRQPLPAVMPSLLVQRAVEMASVDVGQTPSTEVYAENKIRLRRYDSLTDTQRDVPIVLVPAVINRPYILDLQPDRSVVRQFLSRGFDMFLVDWGEPSRLDTTLEFADYVERYLANVVRVVRERTGASGVHLLGYCTGGTLATLYAALHPDAVQTLGLLAPVLAFDTDEGIFGLWRSDEHVHPETVSRTFGNVPGELLAVEFAMQDPVEYLVARYLRLADHLDDVAHLKRAARRLRWGRETVDVPGRLYEQFLEELYQENKLMTGDFEVGGQSVDLDELRMPILDIIGADDQFVPPAASRPFIDAVPSADTTVIEFPTGHVGLSISDRAHEELWPAVCDWYDER